MRNIYPCLWFDTQAEAAAQFYVSIFRNSRILSTSRYAEGMPLPAGTVLTVSFELDGKQFLALNGGPMFKLSEAFSLVVECDTQQEIDGLWEKLSAGGQEQQCGWLKDKFGLSWQIVPAKLGEWMQSGDPARSQRVMQALMPMVKLDIAALQRAYDGGE